MLYKTEMHCHTSEVSSCSTQNCYDKVDQYVEAGFTTIVLTNHYSNESTGFKDNNIEYGINVFVDTYRKMKEYAKERINILLGAEIRFWEDNYNDYLTYGITEEFLFSHPEIINLYQTKYYDLCKENGFLVIQAHPFRTGMILPNNKFVDGIEVFNSSNSGDPHNDIADTWANYYGFIKTAGSDHHNANQLGYCGILTDYPITNNEQLIRTLKKGTYSLVKEETPGRTRPV